MLCKNIWLCLVAILTTLGSIASALNHFCFVEDLLSKTSAIRCGAEDVVGITKQRFVDRLTWLKCLMRFNASNWYDRKNFDRVSYVLEMMRLDDSNGSIRQQPYCILLTGYPGCGKSNYALRLAAACLKAKYGKAHARDIVTLNETDEFQSEFRTSHKVVIFDDLGAENPNRDPPNPWRKVIDFVNNIRKTSLNPNVEMKGNVYIEPDLVIITTNLGRGFDLRQYLRAPGAVFRRLKKIVFLQQDYDDAKVLGKEVSQNTLQSVYDYNNYELQRTDVPIVKRSDLENDIVEEFLQFDRDQKDFVNETNSILDKVDNKSVFRSFYDDLISPFTVNLPNYLETKLPFCTRFIRKFFHKEDIPICMMGDACSLNDAIIYEPQSRYDPFSEYDEKLIEYLVDKMDWKFYELIRKFLVHSEKFEFFDGMIFDGTYRWTWKNSDFLEGKGLECCKIHLDLAFERRKQQRMQAKNKKDDISVDIPVNMIWHYLYKRSKDVMKVDDNQAIVEWMNIELDRSALGQLKDTDTMAMVQYLIAMRSRLRSFRCLGVEYSLYGFRPDVVLKSGDYTIVIECKNTKCTLGKRQVENYLRALRDDDKPSLGVLFSQREVKFYSLDVLPKALISNVQELVFDVLEELERRSLHFGTTHFQKIDRCGAVGPVELLNTSSTNFPTGIS